MADWEDEWAGEDNDAEPNTAGADLDFGDLDDKFAGEDEDEDTLLGDDWDAEEKPKEEEKKQTVPGERTLTNRQKQKKKEALEAVRQKEKEELEKKLADPEYQKWLAAKQKRDIEKAELAVACDLFDGCELGDDSIAEGNVNADNADMGLDDMDEFETMDQPKIDKPGIENYKLNVLSDYKAFASEIAAKLIESDNGKKKINTVEFFKALINGVEKHLKLEDTNEIKKVIMKISDDKRKNESNKKKPKAGGKKATLTMSKSKGGGDFDGFDY